MITVTNTLFDSRPLAIHCPGPPHPEWSRIVAEALTPSPACSCPDATIITWHGTNRPAKPNGIMERSLDCLGQSATVLNGREPWSNLQKLSLTADALQHINTPYVIGADSCDVIFLANPQIIVDRFRTEFTCKLLFNAAPRCWPELPEFVSFQSSLPQATLSHGRHWLNAGLWIGETTFCREYFAQVANEPPEPLYDYSDQAIVNRTWPRWFPRVNTDCFCRLFQCFSDDSRIMRAERRTDARQIALLNWFRRLPPPIVGAEIGVCDGHTSEALLRNLPELRLWMIDSWEPYSGQSELGEMSPERFASFKAAAIWWTEFAAERRHILPEASPGASHRFAAESLDCVFIDANHQYESVRNDLESWWPKIRPGGLMTGHDYAIGRDLSGEWGVRRAVDEFAARMQRQIELGADGTWCLTK